MKQLTLRRMDSQMQRQKRPKPPMLRWKPLRLHYGRMLLLASTP